MSNLFTKVGKALGIDQQDPAPSPKKEAATPKPPLKGETAMAATTPTKEKQPQEVLNFFLNPSNKYMGHFFHIQGDIPVMETEVKTSRSGDAKAKVIFKTKKDRLYLSDVDTIIKKHSELKGKRNYEDISLGILSSSLLELFEQQGLSVDKVIGWAKQEATAKIGAAPKVSKAKAPTEKADPMVRFLVKSIFALAPNKSVEELKAILVQTVNDAAKMEKAGAVVTSKLNELGRDENGFIRMRKR